MARFKLLALAGALASTCVMTGCSAYDMQQASIALGQLATAASPSNGNYNRYTPMPVYVPPASSSRRTSTGTSSVYIPKINPSDYGNFKGRNSSLGGTAGHLCETVGPNSAPSRGLTGPC